VKLSAGAAVVECRVQEDMPVLTASRRSLHQVLLHLLSNAVRAAVPGRLLLVEVGARSTPEGVEFRVCDDGRGLPPGWEGSLFQPFAPGPGSAGFGLGLFLVGQVVAAWAGAVAVRSEPGQGAEFTVFVPRCLCRDS
jgi:signal transduction histidine kinase